MIPTRMVELIKALISKTVSKQAVWGKTSRPSEFKLFLDKGAVTSDYWKDETGDELVDFAIYNIHGDKIDNFVAERGEPDYEVLIDLHNAAKREFYKVDETINSLFDEITSEKSIGKRVIDKDDGLPF